jgi:hypothetical protein
MSNSAPSAPFFPGATIDARKTTEATAGVTAARLVSTAPGARMTGQPGTVSGASVCCGWQRASDLRLPVRSRRLSF